MLPCNSPVPVSKNDGGAVYEARIEDGKLFYENRWSASHTQTVLEPLREGGGSARYQSCVIFLPQVSQGATYIH